MPEPQSPVVPGLEPYEIVYAKDQPEYLPLPVLRSPTGILYSRWKFSAEERAAIAAGADLYVSTHTFFQPLQPIGLEVLHPPDAEQIEHDWELKRELDNRLAFSRAK